ncbi:TPR domain-containing protein [Brachyspira pilosicoli]|nr:TPR domain-containing protein [Brachyspira pilosicoli]
MSGLIFLLVIMVVFAFTRYFILPKIFSKDSKKLKNMLKKHIMI